MKKIQLLVDSKSDALYQQAHFVAQEVTAVCKVAEYNNYAAQPEAEVTQEEELVVGVEASHEPC